MTCPDPGTPTILAQSGSVNGWTSAFVDGYYDRQGVDFNWQAPIVLVDKPGACAHYQANQDVKGQHLLLLGLVVGKVGSMDPIAPESYPTGTAEPVGSSFEYPAGSGVMWQWQVTWIAQSAKNCNQATTAATSGTVTLSRLDDLGAEGGYDLTFGTSGSLTGTFQMGRCGVAGSPGVAGCPARPGSRTCVSG